MPELSDRPSYRELLLSHPEILTALHRNPVSKDAEERAGRAASELVSRSSRLLASIVQLGCVVEDMEATVRMLSRYPWHKTKVTKVKHLELTWFLFQNLCYKYKEKLKLCFNMQKAVAAGLGFPKPDWIKDELRLVDKALGVEIRHRGGSVHSWNTKQPDLDFFSAVSILSMMRDSGSSVNLPEGFFDVSGHYADAKWILRGKARKMTKETEQIFFRVLEDHDPRPSELINCISNLLEKVNAVNKKSSVTASE